MKVGFTGTHHGMTPQQKIKMKEFLISYGPNDQFHHGKCIGSDEEAQNIAILQGMYTVAHPPTNHSRMAQTVDSDTRPEFPYITRDHHIVDEVDFMIATPYDRTEILRSGTWATIRYTRKIKKKLFIIFPDGQVREE